MMRVKKVYVAMPEGFSLCPRPKFGVNDKTEFKFDLNPEISKLSENDRHDIVLTYLDESEMIIQWKTNHASFKGTTEYLLGVYENRISYKPLSSQDFRLVGSLTATIQVSDIRLYYKHPVFSPNSK